MSSLLKTQMDVGFPSSYTSQLIKWSVELEKEREHQQMKLNVRKSRWSQWSRRSSVLFQPSVRKVIVPLPNAVRSILHELQICWTVMQLTSVVWFMTKVDWQLRLYGPFNEFPNYTPRSMPWLPSQYEMHTRLKVSLVMLICFYIPGVLVHFNYVLDDCPDETPLQLVRKVFEAQNRRKSIRKSRRWTFDTRFDLYRRPRRRQWATCTITVFLILLFFYNVTILIVDCNCITVKSWEVKIKEWLKNGQQIYFNHVNESINQSDPLEKFGIFNRSTDKHNILDRVHITFKCCGPDGFIAYRDEILKFQQSKQQFLKHIGIQHSCCNDNFSDCDNTDLKKSEQFYQNDCVKPITENIICRWKKLALINLLIITISLIPQLILFLSIFHIRAAIQQYAIIILEMYAQITFWQRTKKITQQRVRQQSELLSRPSKNHLLRLSQIQFKEENNMKRSVTTEE
ncbi:unnamed protein product [Heterobilharzia americana]|nr:unnamed protein product [Heterobilharzia americana]